MEILIVFVVGIVSGVLAGILPGIGGAVIMTLAFPILMTLDPVSILVFYMTMASVDQFFNGVTAIVLGVPGASMNIPTQIEGHKLFKQGKGDEAIMFSAVGSYIASMFAILLVICLLPVLWGIYGIWTSTLQSILLSTAAIVLILVSRNNKIISFVLFALGGALSQVGYSEERGTSFMTFGSDMLYSGIPILPVLVSLFVVPVLLKSYLDKGGSFYFPGVNFQGYVQTLKNMRHMAVTLLRSCGLGSIGGLVPGMSFGFSSLLAYVTERWLRTRAGKYREGDMPCLVACESANNAGVFTQMVPLLFLGIPITASEAIIYNILEARGLPVDIEWFRSTFLTVLGFFFISSTVGLILAAKYVNGLKILNGLKLSTVYSGVILALVLILWQTGVANYSGLDHLYIALALLPFGLLFTRLDTTPLIFGFLLSEPLLDNLKRILVIYF